MEAQETPFVWGILDGDTTTEVVPKIFVQSQDKNWLHCYLLQETEFGLRYLYDGIYYAKNKKKWVKEKA